MIGNQFTSYTHEYDEEGNLLEVTDSNGGFYDVYDECYGVVSVTGPDG